MLKSCGWVLDLACVWLLRLVWQERSDPRSGEQSASEAAASLGKTAVL